MNFDFFRNVIILNTSNDAFYSVGMYASDSAGAELSFLCCGGTDDCSSNAHYSQLVKKVPLTQNIVTAIKIKMVYNSGTSKVEIHVDDDTTAVNTNFNYFIL